MDFGLSFILLLYIDCGFSPIFYPNTIDYEFRLYIYGNTIHYKFCVISIIIV